MQKSWRILDCVQFCLVSKWTLVDVGCQGFTNNNVFRLTGRTFLVISAKIFVDIERMACSLKKFYLTPFELSFALKSFLVKVLLFCVIECLICQFDSSRLACRLVGRGFLPSLVVFAFMDLLVIPQLRRRIRVRWSINELGGFSPRSWTA